MACHAVQLELRPTAHFTPLRSLRGHKYRNIIRHCCAAYCGLHCNLKPARPRLCLPNKQTGNRSTSLHFATETLTCVERCILCRAFDKVPFSDNLSLSHLFGSFNISCRSQQVRSSQAKLQMSTSRSPDCRGLGT